jgi:hypothetical protein
MAAKVKLRLFPTLYFRRSELEEVSADREGWDV